MTEEQKRELEKQANYYSHDFFERLKNGLNTEIPNTRFLALARAVGVFGYEFVEDGKGELLGTEYNTYKLVEINK